MQHTPCFKEYHPIEGLLSRARIISVTPHQNADSLGLENCEGKRGRHPKSTSSELLEGEMA